MQPIEIGIFGEKGKIGVPKSEVHGETKIWENSETRKEEGKGQRRILVLV